MDPLSNYSSITPTYLDFPFSDAQAQQLLQSIGWTYYTIWKKDSTQNPPSNCPGRLAWSKGDVNSSLLTDQNNVYESMGELITRGNHSESHQISKACKMGYSLQQFYKDCSFLPMGLGIAGIAMASGRDQLAFGEELFKQISLLSTYNQQSVPSALHEHFFQTVVCIPLPNGAGVLEMGTETLVLEGDGMLSQVLDFIHELAAGTHTRDKEKILNSTLDRGFRLIPWKLDGQSEYGEPDEHDDTLKVMQMLYGGSAIRQSSLSSSYCSSSSAASSPLSADHQKGSSSFTSTTCCILNSSHIPSMSNEDLLISTPTSLQATSLTIENSINQLDILSQLGHIGLHSGRSTPISTIPTFCYQELNPNADQHGASSNQFYFSPPALYFSATASRPLSPLPQHDTQYHQHHFLQDNLLQGNPQQQQWGSLHSYINDQHKLIESSSGKSTQEVPRILNRLSTSSAAAGISSRACKDKIIQEQVTDSRLEAHRYYMGVSNCEGGLNEACKEPLHDEGGEMVGLGAAASFCEFAKDYQYTTSMQQAAGKVQYVMNMELQGVSLDHYINTQQGAGSDDHYINIQHHTPGNRSAFRRWSRSFFAVSYERTQKRAAKDSFLKTFLKVYLPTHRGSEVRRGSRAGTSRPLMQNIGGTSRDFLQARLQEVATQLDHPSTMMMTASESTQNEAAVNHMYAERIRRRKQAECYKALRNLVPNISKKKDKVATLERSIQYLQELKDRVCELEHAKDALMYMNSEDNIKDAIKNSSQNTSSEEIARCLCIPPPISKHGIYFQLNVNKFITKHEEANMTTIEILSALQKKNLHCIKFRSNRLQKNTRIFDIEILAKYKDGDNCTLSLDRIREIEEWWPKFMKDL